jgi:hypothetical protein
MPPRFSRTEEDRHEHDDGQPGAHDSAGGEKAHREAGTDTPGETAGEEGREGNHTGLGKQRS